MIQCTRFTMRTTRQNILTKNAHICAPQPTHPRKQRIIFPLNSNFKSSLNLNTCLDSLFKAIYKIFQIYWLQVTFLIFSTQCVRFLSWKISRLSLFYCYLCRTVVRMNQNSFLSVISLLFGIGILLSIIGHSEGKNILDRSYQ